MRKETMKYLSIIFLSLTLGGCSFVVEIMLFNNTGSPVEVCNIHNSDRPCVEVASYEMGSVPMINNMKADSWAYSIKGKVYTFVMGTYPEHASEVYCKGFIQKRCAIPLQLEPSDLLYWAGKNNRLPVSSFVNQPKGFPVEPSA